MMDGKSSLPVKQIASEYLEAFEKLLHQLDLDAVERIIHRLQVARDSGAMIYVAGNGGSAAAASHWVNDLGKMTKLSGRTPMRVMRLHWAMTKDMNASLPVSWKTLPNVAMCWW
jgi:phosphoheptose isomerase